MLQASETPVIKPYDWFIITPAAWLMSQSILSGQVFWFLLGYFFFINYAIWRRENG